MSIGSSIVKAFSSSGSKKKSGYNYNTEVNRDNKWESQLNDIYNQINGREKFSYDMNNDAFYKQYAQQYAANAKLAMEDTVGQVSALTGGYANSYAATAGQAMYNQQMDGLNDKATELYQLALQQYNSESDRLNNLYGITADAYGMEQDRINSEIAEAQWATEFEESKRQYNQNMAYQYARAAAQDAQWAAELAENSRQFNTSLAEDTRQFDESLAYDKERAAVSDEQWQKTFDYNAERDSVADSQWEQEFNYQKQRDATSDSQFAQELAYKYASLTEEQRQFDIGNEVDGDAALSGIPEDLRLYLENSNHYQDATESRAKAILTKLDDGEITETQAKKLFDFYGIDY